MAYGQPGAVEDLPREVLRAQFEAGFFGWHDLTRRVVPIMRKQWAGRIVFCSSVLGLVSAPYRGAYCATKFAVEALADALRMELAETAIKIVLIEPGPIASRFLDHALEAYRRHIDLEGSHHRDIYRARIARLEEGGDQTFKLGPEAVALKLAHALESRNPKRRYYVTVPTYVAALLRPVAADQRARRHCRAQLECRPGASPRGASHGSPDELRHSGCPYRSRHRAPARALEHDARRQRQHQPAPDALAGDPAIYRPLPGHGRHLAVRPVGCRP
jgi:short-subunit dehydrogenase